ncbi:MAG: hypothetical protein ACYTG6_17130, partial [Planctomycetota bacterium]
RSDGTQVFDPSGVDVGSLATNGQFVGGFGPSADDPEVVLAKACWNFWLLHSDGSHGIHNPTFTGSVGANTLHQVSALNWTLTP